MVHISDLPGVSEQVNSFREETKNSCENTDSCYSIFMLLLCYNESLPQLILHECRIPSRSLVVYGQCIESTRVAEEMCAFDRFFSSFFSFGPPYTQCMAYTLFCLFLVHQRTTPHQTTSHHSTLLVAR